MMTGNDDKNRKFTEICELCTIDLDFDAFVFSKLKNGPQDEFTRFLSQPIDSEIAKKLVENILETYKQNLDSPQVLAHLNSQIHFLIVRWICSSEPRDAKSITTWIPDDIRRRYLFPELQNNRVDYAMEIAGMVVNNFMKTSSVKWELSTETLNVLENLYSRIAISQILDSFRFSIGNPKLFDEFVTLVPESNHHNDDLLQTVTSALRFAMWIVENWKRLENSIEIDFWDERSAKVHLIHEILKTFTSDDVKIQKNTKDVVAPSQQIDLDNNGNELGRKPESLSKSSNKQSHDTEEVVEEIGINPEEEKGKSLEGDDFYKKNPEAEKLEIKKEKPLEMVSDDTFTIEPCVLKTQSEEENSVREETPPIVEPVVVQSVSVGKTLEEVSDEKPVEEHESRPWPPPNRLRPRRVKSRPEPTSDFVQSVFSEVLLCSNFGRGGARMKRK
ncbi:Protein CBG00587 [Caenorhabditis briggsae]|uniref:Protein CBG00587 n=1 Tax=Caenorhabditis briggsae TaxID=6238 RepID=B0K058_CAEBR|nr:Protein CBG00587 [Caenorhabditis briggsae]CAP22041.1 Protein CBG00587 [Caenorhabditis briggsae]